MKEGVWHGQWHEYFGKGFFSEGPYVEGKKHGLWRTTTTRTQDYDYEELEKPHLWFCFCPSLLSCSGRSRVTTTPSALTVSGKCNKRWASLSVLF